MKKCWILVIFLIIIFVAYTFFSQRQQMQDADQTFIYNLSEANSCFGVDYTKLSEEDKISYYMKAASSLNVAIYTLKYTSYDDKQDLGNALGSLNLSISLHCKSQSTNRSRAFNEKEHDIFMCLSHIIFNTKDKNNCKELIKVTNEIGY